MFVRHSGELIEILAPAKLNLFLEVLQKREDGFHEIETLMMTVNLFDTLRFISTTRAEITVTCNWASGLRGQEVSKSSFKLESALGDLPGGTDNIVLRAVQLLQRRAGVGLGGRLQLVKRIPSAAGLGGASSDAAAALVAANRAWKLGWSTEQLSELAAELGSDVPFFLSAGLAVCRGRGEKINPVQSCSADLQFVIVRPPGGLATRLVYKNCRPAAEPVCVEPLLKAVHAGDSAAVGSLLVNRLQAVAEKFSPWVARLSHEFSQMGCLGHQMSGSGTSYFGIFRHGRNAKRAMRLLRSRGVGHVWHARALNTRTGC